MNATDPYATIMGINESELNLAEKWRIVIHSVDHGAHRYFSPKRDGIATLCENIHRHVKYGQCPRHDTITIDLATPEEYMINSLNVLMNAWDMLESRGIEVRTCSNPVGVHELEDGTKSTFEVTYCDLDKFNLGLFHGDQVAYLYNLDYDQKKIGYGKI